MGAGGLTEEVEVVGGDPVALGEGGGAFYGDAEFADVAGPGGFSRRSMASDLMPTVAELRHSTIRQDLLHIRESCSVRERLNSRVLISQYRTNE